jgi:hypothetical protein
MLIFDENYRPAVLDDIDNTVMADYFWVLDLNMMDFTPVPLQVIEEISCKSLEIRVGDNAGIIVPADWNILIVSDETSCLDVAEIGREIPGANFYAFTYGQRMKTFVPQPVLVSNYFEDFKNITPALQKHQMLCHPISEHAWINISPFDTYTKYFKNSFAGDLI